MNLRAEAEEKGGKDMSIADKCISRTLTANSSVLPSNFKEIMKN